MAGDSLSPFSPAVRAWFESSFPEPTAAQAQAWGPISAGENTLLCAPTGSGKTLAAFLWAIDSLGARSVQARDQSGSASEPASPTEPVCLNSGLLLKNVEATVSGTNHIPSLEP